MQFQLDINTAFAALWLTPHRRRIAALAMLTFVALC